MTAGRLARAAALVAVFGLVSRLLGFAREVVLAAAYGATGVTDAYVNSLLIVNSVAAVLLYTLVTLIIPTFGQERAAHGTESAWRLVTALAVWVGGLLVVLSALAALFPQPLAALFALDPARAHATETLIRIMAPALGLQGLSAIFTAMLQIHGRFAGPAAVGVAFNFGIILGVAAGQSELGIRAAAWGVVLGAALQVALQLPQFWRLLRQAGTPLVATHPRLALVALTGLPVIGASLLQQINNFTDKLFASSLTAGRVSALSFANALGQAPRAAILLPLLTPLFPLIARQVAEGHRDEALRTFSRVAGLLALTSVPAMALLAIYADEVSQLAFQRGRCGVGCVAQIGPPLLWYALGLWPGFATLLLNRTLSAANLQRVILWTTVGTVTITIVLDVILLGPMQQAGLALAATIGVYANVAMLVLSLRRHFPELALDRLARRQLRVLAATVPAAATALLLNLVLPTDDLDSTRLVAPLLAKILIALGVYVVVARALAGDELSEGARAVGALVGRRGAARR